MANLWTGKTVVIADDSALVRGVLEKQFQQAGMKVIGKATNGVEAIDMVTKLNPDLLSLDIIMPEMSGLECYRLLRAQGVVLRVLLTSCLASEPSVVAGLASEVPAHIFLPKPFDQVLLEGRLFRVFSELEKPLGSDLPALSAQNEDATLAAS